MLWWIVAILLVLWLGGLVLNIAGGVIHVLLLLAIFVAVGKFLQKKN